MKKIILAGNAITADILNNYLTRDNRYEVTCLTVDDEFVDQGGISGLDTIALSQLASHYPAEEYVVIMAMGYSDINRSRESMFYRLKELGYTIETYIHPDARVYTANPLGEGCVILPSAVIEPHVSVGANSMIWANVTVAHHAKIAEHCWLASGAVISGQARIERNSFIGVNATIVNEVIVGEYCIIGAGALISKNTKASTVHLARSAEPLRYSSDDYVKYFGV
jgi:sugar O-acyltransferase (sialic acid O-acetyltransferase NeuD family)